MVTKKHSEIDLLVGGVSASDTVIVRDISDTAINASGKTKQVSIAQLKPAVGGVVSGGDLVGAGSLSVGNAYSLSSGSSGYDLTLPAIDGNSVSIGDIIVLNAGKIAGTVSIVGSGGNTVTGYMTIHDMHSNQTFKAEVISATSWRVSKENSKIDLKEAYSHNAITYPYLSTINKNLKTKCVAGINIESLELGPARNPAEGVGGYYIINSSDFDFYALRGFKLIRMPIRWENLQDDLFENLNPVYLNYIKIAIEDALAAGCEVIIDLHNYAQYVSKQDGIKRNIGTTEVPYDAYFDIWKRISLEFGNQKGIHFCLMNEPSLPNEDLPLWVEKQQELVLVLREMGIATHLQISTNVYTSAIGHMQGGKFKLWENFYDPLNNWTFEVHQYIDYLLDGGGDEFGEGNTLESDDPVGAYSNLKEIVEWARRHKIKLHIGEMGIAHDSSLYPMNQKAMYNYLRFMEDNYDVIVSFTPWGGASRGWGSYALGYFPHSNQSTYDAAFETGTRPGIDPVVTFKTYDIENEAYDPVNLQILKSFHKVNEYPEWADFIFDYEKNNYGGFHSESEVVSFSRASKARSLNKMGNYELFNSGEKRITDLGLNPEPLRIQLYQTPLFTTAFNTVNDPELDNITKARNIPSPDGYLNALRLTDNSVDGQHVAKYAIESGELTEGEALAASISTRFVSQQYAYFGFNGLGQNMVHDFSNSTPEKGAKEWVRLTMSGLKTGSGGAREIMFGHNDGTSLSVSHKPNDFVGAGTSTDFALAQLERCPLTGTGEEYEGLGFATSPIVGSAIGSQREADDYQFIGPVLEALDGDFTLFMAWHEMPIVACKMPIFKLNNINLLQRNADSSVGSPYAGVDTAVMLAGNSEHFLGKKVAISVSKSTGEVILYAQGVAPVSATGLTLPTITSAQLGNHAGFNKKILIVREAYTSAQIQQIVDFEI